MSILGHIGFQVFSEKLLEIQRRLCYVNAILSYTYKKDMY